MSSRMSRNKIYEPPAVKEAVKEVVKKFNGEPASFTPQQLQYINKMFEAKGPVLVRMGIKKGTRFYGPKEWIEVQRLRKIF